MRIATYRRDGASRAGLVAADDVVRIEIDGLGTIENRFT